MQLQINSYNDIVFEWIPYNQFNDIKKIAEDGFAEVYSAIWQDGPLNYISGINNYTRIQDKKIGLECFYNSQNNIDEFLNKV